MKNIKIFQIIYNESTKESMDPGFLPLDNMRNSRADWREYWPIRNYLLDNVLDENCLYGFFSPKFKSKTGLTATDCFNFINSQPNEIDVFAFSPFYDLGAFFQNSFYQAIAQHPESEFAMIEGLKIIDQSIAIDNFVMTSGNNIFCNFFVAKASFWKVWLEKCELIWDECEKNNSPAGRALNKVEDTHDSPALLKTFLIERIASFILSTNPSWKVKAYNPFVLPFSTALLSKERTALIQMDALKIAYVNQNRSEHLSLFKDIAELVLRKLGKRD